MTIGSKNHQAKLTEMQVIEMRMKKQMNPSITNKQLAEEYNISYAQACRIIRGQRWKHVDLGSTKYNESRSDQLKEAANNIESESKFDEVTRKFGIDPFIAQAIKQRKRSEVTS